MKSNAFATSMSSAAVTKANGQHPLSELPRKTVRFDPSQTSANQTNGSSTNRTQCQAFMNYSNASKGLLTVPLSISTWDSGQSFRQVLATPMHDHLTLGKILLPSSSNGTCQFTRYIPRKDVRTIHQHDLRHCLSRRHTRTYL
jgi:hypothetical protein